ncbi:MAG: integron [Pseudomonadota bacterium]
MKRAITACFAVSATFSLPGLAIAAAEFETGERLIMVGHDGPDFDACASIGQVHGLKNDGDGFLSVRIAPGTASKERDQLPNGIRLSLCDAHEDWYGVVYQKPGDDLADCGTGTPSAYVGAYRGPCRYGWVHKYFVEHLAG